MGRRVRPSRHFHSENVDAVGVTCMRCRNRSKSFKKSHLSKHEAFFTGHEVALLGSKGTGWIKLKIAMSVTLFGLEREGGGEGGGAEEREAGTVCVSR